MFLRPDELLAAVQDLVCAAGVCLKGECYAVRFMLW